VPSRGDISIIVKSHPLKIALFEGRARICFTYKPFAPAAADTSEAG
jgi:hypothetical protein